MRALNIIFTLYATSAFAFVPQQHRPGVAFRVTPQVLRSTAEADTETEQEVPIVINGQNIELTPALVDHVKKRIGRHLNKLSRGGAVKECDVVLSVSRNPKVKNNHRVEIVTSLKGTSIICHNESPDMYDSIDSAAHALNRKLCKYKERRTAGHHGGAAMAEDLMAALDALEEVQAAEDEEDVDEFGDYVDPEAPVITKVNSFDLDNAISIQEAIFALDYTDHDFYVFKNEENGKLSVVYKRHVGGVGLVEP